jgi:Arc/MetJ family transcription regulator
MLLSRFCPTLTFYAWISKLVCITSREDIMRTTLDLPEELVAKAMQATNIKTKTKVIIAALEQLIRKSKISEIKSYKGQVDLEIDLDVIRGRKCQL